MKELPHSSLLPTNTIKDKIFKQAARFVLRKAPHVLPVFVLILASCSGSGVGEKNSNGITNDSNRPVAAGPKEPTQTVEKPAEAGWSQFQSPVLPYQIKHPSSWRVDTGDINYESFSPKTDDDTSLGSIGFNIFTKPLDTSTPPEIMVEKALKNYKEKGIKLTATQQFVSGQQAWKIEGKKEISDSLPSINYLFFYQDREWIIALDLSDSRKYIPGSVNLSEIQPTLRKMMESFKLLPTAASQNSLGASPTFKPTETLKPPGEKKIFGSKKPEELFLALLTSSISMDLLPQGMSSRGTSAGEIDATGKALKQIGAVNILIEDSVSILSGKVFYGIFPDSSGAKSASELIGTHLGNGQVLKDFPYPTKVYSATSDGVAATVIVASVKNVTLMTSLIGTDSNIIESRSISLAQSAIKHLEKVGEESPVPIHMDKFR